MEDKIELKEKKPRTEKQIEAFKKAQEIRKESLKIKREKIKEIKDLKPVDILSPIDEPSPQQLHEESDNEPEIIYVKKESKKKPKKKKIIIEESSSSSDEEIVQVRKPQRYQVPKNIESKEILYRFI